MTTNIQLVWPDAGIESGQILHKSCQRWLKQFFSSKVTFFMIAQKLFDIWATFVQ